MAEAILALEDGRVFPGELFGAPGEKAGEVIFNTGLTGYQEVLTDPSYKGQIVAMTYPHIGNYGINEEDFESRGPQVEGFVVREQSQRVSNWRAKESLSEFLARHGIVGISGVDTRALTRHLRYQGAMKGIISSIDLNPENLVAKAMASPGLVGRDLALEVTCPAPYEWQGKTDEPWLPEGEFPQVPVRFHVVVYDFGVKFNILRRLRDVGCQVMVVPAVTAASQVLAMEPDGVLLSNGPGDPEPLTYAVEAARELFGKVPIFGICQGQHILGMAYGGKTYKLKFGHHGCNQPVKNLATGRVEITSQNHGFVVDIKTIQDPQVELTHLNLNDHTLEGTSHRKLPIFSVQYHPEASPGPRDASYLFRNFAALMERHRHGRKSFPMSGRGVQDA